MIIANVRKKTKKYKEIFRHIFDKGKMYLRVFLLILRHFYLCYTMSYGQLLCFLNQTDALKYET